MSSSNNLTLTLVFGFVGIGIGLINGVILGVLIGGFFGDGFTEIDDYQEHYQVEVIEFEKRDREVYLKFRNNGELPVDDMYFEIEVRGKDGKLRQEYEMRYAKLVAPGETEETILKPQEVQIEPVDLEGELSVQYKYGWRTVSEE